MNGTGIPEDIAAQLRRRGPVIDVAGTKALYAPLLARQPRDGVRVETDLAYGDDARHRLDVYVPQAQAPHGVLVFLHGGGFLRGDKGERANVGHAFARDGYLVVLPNYRLAPSHRWPAGALDVAAVLRWVAEHAGTYDAGAVPVVVAGESAGAAHVAASRLLKQFAETAPAPAGMVLISGPYNPRLEGLARAQFGIATPDPRNEAYFGADPAAWDGMSTVDLVDVAPFPVLMSYAELDPPQMQVQAGELFARLVSRHGFRPALRVIRGHDHLSQLYSIGTGDDSLAGVLRAWLARLREGRDTSVV